MINTVPAARPRLHQQSAHRPFRLSAYHDRGDWLRWILKARDRDRKFSARYPSVETEGAVFRPAMSGGFLPEANYDRDKSDPVARDGHKESRPRAT
jgi:hypothetical protein